MEEFWGILNSRWQIITLGFQIYIFGEERLVKEKELTNLDRRIFNYLKFLILQVIILNA